MSNLPIVPQDFYDNNRQRFDAESTSIDIKGDRCDHYFIRSTTQKVRCKRCEAAWIDMGIWEIEDGKHLD